MGRSAASATDDFNRADESPLASPWAQIDASFKVNLNTNMIIGSHQGGSGSEAGDYSAAVYNSGSFADDQWSSLQIAAWSAGSPPDIRNLGVMVRASTDTGSGRDYYFVVIGSTVTSTIAKVTLGKFVNGTKTILNQEDVDAGWAAGDRIELEAVGTTVRVCRNGTPLGGSFTQTDSSLTTGKPGVNIMGGTIDLAGDNWEAGDMTPDIVGATQLPTRRHTGRRRQRYAI